MYFLGVGGQRFWLELIIYLNQAWFGAGVVQSTIG
jgi:hypothetical protein